jgi:hypothetical protein
VGVSAFGNAGWMKGPMWTAYDPRHQRDTCMHHAEQDEWSVTPVTPIHGAHAIKLGQDEKEAYPIDLLNPRLIGVFLVQDPPACHLPECAV